MATQEQVAQMMATMQALTQQVAQMSADNSALHKTQQEAAAATTERERQFRVEMEQNLLNATARNEAATSAAVAAGAAAAAATAGTGSDALPGGQPGGIEGAVSSAMVSKWAPDSFSGKEEDWRVWSPKFRSYVGAMAKGQVGVWMDHARAHQALECKLNSLAPAAHAPAAVLYSSLMAVCEGKSFYIVERAGGGEGIEAWRLLLNRYESQTRQSRVLMMMAVLAWDFKQGELLDCLEAFDRACQRYTDATSKVIDDDTKIGIVIKGMESGSLREHMLLHSERCETYEEFRNEVDTIAKARAAQFVVNSPMDLGAFNKKGGGKDQACHNCGKKGHKAADCWAGGGKSSGGAGGAPLKCTKCGKSGHSAKDCWSKGGGGQKGGKPSGKPAAANANAEKRECFKCGMNNHIAKDCRASEAKRSTRSTKRRKEACGTSTKSLPTPLAALGACASWPRVHLDADWTAPVEHRAWQRCAKTARIGNSS